MSFGDWFELIYSIISIPLVIWCMCGIISIVWDDIWNSTHSVDPDEEWRKFKHSFKDSNDYEKWLNNMVERDIQKYKECQTRKEHK